MSRVRNRRTGKWIDLPDEIPNRVNFRHRTVTPEQAQAIACRLMGNHDYLSEVKRWEDNYCRLCAGKLYSHYFPDWQPDKTTPPKPSKLTSIYFADEIGL